MSSVFRRKKLLQKGYYHVGEAVDPDNITWENLGISARSKTLRWLGAAIVLLILCVISFSGVLQMSNLEKDYVHYMKSDCSGRSTFSQDLALADIIRPQKQQLGLMNCYCSQMLETFGESGVKIIFEDGEKYCENWYRVYYMSQYTTLILALWLCFMNLVSHIVLNWFAHLRRPKNRVDGFKQTAIQVFLAQYINTAILFMFAYHSFF